MLYEGIFSCKLLCNVCKQIVNSSIIDSTFSNSSVLANDAVVGKARTNACLIPCKKNSLRELMFAIGQIMVLWEKILICLLPLPLSLRSVYK